MQDTNANESKRKFLVIGFLLAMMISNLFMVANLVPKLRNGYQDFTIFYTAATLLRTGHAAQLYDLRTQYQMETSFTNVPIRLGPLPYNHPPFEALIFLPFSCVSYWHAYLLWTAVNLCLLIAAVWLLSKSFVEVGGIPPLLAALAALAFFPIVLGIMQGQDVILMLLLFAGALFCLDRNYDAAAGAWLALGLFRPHLALAVAVLLALRRWKILIGFIPVAIALGGVTVAILGWSGPLDYARFVLHIEKTAARGFGLEAVPNLRGLFSSFPGVHAPSQAVNILVLVSSVAVFAIAAWRICSGRDGINFCFALATVTALLVSFHVLTYDLVLLLPLGLFLVVNWLRESKPSATSVLATLLYLTPLYVLLMTVIDSFFWFSLVLIGLYLKLILDPPAKSGWMNHPV